MSDSPDRYLGLKSVRNLRDLGGYTTIDNRMVKWRTLFRSGNLVRLSPNDADSLKKLNIAQVLDFRSESEKARDGLIAIHGWEPAYIPLPIGGNAAAWLKELHHRLVHEDFPSGEMSNIFRKVYTDYPTVHAKELGVFLTHVSELKVGDAFLFNCTAGKDRTGIAAVLLLSLLGVDRDQIIEDYMLTNQYVDIDQRSQQSADWIKKHYNRDINPTELLPLFGVQEDFLQETFNVIDSISGSFTDYAINHCGVELSAIDRLRDRFIEDY